MAKPSKKNNGVTRKWLAIYSRPRWEKKVNQLLVEKGFESYCPLNKVRRKWSDRMKIVEEPLFKSYVFVKVTDEDRTAVRMTPGVINFVYWEGKPAVIKEKEITIIKPHGSAGSSACKDHDRPADGPRRRSAESSKESGKSSY